MIHTQKLEDFSLPPSRHELFSLRDHFRTQGALKVDTIMTALIRPTVVGVLYRIALKIPSIFNMMEFYKKKMSKNYMIYYRVFHFYFMLNTKLVIFLYGVFP